MKPKRAWLPLLAILFFSFFGATAFAQVKNKDADKAAEKDLRRFKVESVIKHTPVKNQARTGTCWDFATVSFIESEVLRRGGPELDLSEMWVVRNTYPRKAQNYVRQHGGAQFGQGGQSHDVFDTVVRQGIVPEAVYSGMNIGENRHNHSELFTLLKGVLDAVVKTPGGKLTPRWPEAVDAILDVYLGKPPATFSHEGKSYTPKSFFLEVVKLDSADYIELTSYSTYPFYKKCRLELPDNWSQNDQYYNLPIDDFESVIDHALKTGYSVVWDGDVSEREFGGRAAGYAYVPLKEWDDLTAAEREAKATEPEKEREVDQALRDLTLANYTTTDDHLMHLVGLAQDQKGTKFYYTKNSGGPDRKYDGFLYMSRSYVRLKTTAIMVHKKALPAALAQKLGIQ